MRSRSMSPRGASTCMLPQRSSRAGTRPGSLHRRTICAATAPCSPPILVRPTKAAISIFYRARPRPPSRRFIERIGRSGKHSRQLARGQHERPALAEADPCATGFGAETAETDLIAVFQKTALLAVRQGEWLRTAGGQFKKTAPARWLRPGYGAGADQVSDLKIAAIAGVMRDHLRKSPIHQRGRALRQTLRRHAVLAQHCRGCEISVQRDVQSALRAVLRV